MSSSKKDDGKDKIGQQFGQVRHSIDVDGLNRYLSANVPAIQTPVTVKQFSYGQSNPTYILFDPKGTRYVLRKKPPGGLLSSTAHAIEREYRIIGALFKYNQTLPAGSPDAVPVPEVFCLCEDASIVGTSFYIMQFIHGRIFEDYRMLQLPSKAEREACWKSAITTLAALHRITPEAIGLGDYGGAKAFYTRQMKSLGKVSAVQAGITDKATGETVGAIPDIDSFLAWFGIHMPADENTIVHGDYKIDNLIFHPTEPRVIGILDWELSTRGHPLSDLANLLQPYSLPCDASSRGRINDPALWEQSRQAGSLLLALGGLSAADSPVPLEHDLLRTYCIHAKRAYPIPAWTAAKAWAWFRLAVISQGIAARNAQGQASSAQAKVYGSKFPVCAKAMFSVIESDSHDDDAAAAAGTPKPKL
ncbi:APH-domain-containing protein [Testicularia cyperi]|uniref:APH-domain-containing protein n=1 Tax=Testicularia cyperi TaxID=1882483 RepID=A0A317XKK9_9BASI|nr:APH-domain-containing protein [Testicularia cyperi]